MTGNKAGLGGAGATTRPANCDLTDDKTILEIVGRLKAGKGRGTVRVEGSWGSFAAMLACCIRCRVNRPILYICPHTDDAENVCDDLHTFGNEATELFDALETVEDFADATDEISARRLKTTLKLFSGQDNLIVAASVQALCQPTVKPQHLMKTCLRLQSGKELPPGQVIEWLVDKGFERVERIDLPGQFVHKGGIIDIYAPLTDDKNKGGLQAEAAVRVEFFGDEIESIRLINLDSNLSDRQIEKIDIFSTAFERTCNERELLINLLPPETIVILEEPVDIEQTAETFCRRMEDSDNLYRWQDIYKALGQFTQLHIGRFATSEHSDFLKVDIASVQRFVHKAG